MMMKQTLAAALACLAATSLFAQDAPLTPRFAAETDSGIAARYEGGADYMVGGGVASLDCSGDGFPDLYFAGGSGPARLYRNASTQGGALKFTEVDGGVGLDKVLGAYPLDIDSDGILDLVILRLGENVVMQGKGDCRFTRANEAWGFDGGDAWSAAFAATWEQGALWPTIAIGNYIDRNQPAMPWGSCTDNWLHRPNAGGTGFAPPLPLKPSYCPLSMLFTDWNGSGTPSLRVSNDREYYKGGSEQMWRIEPGADPVLLTQKDGWNTLKIWGMGIASRDLDADGYSEYFLTSMADNKLQKLVPPADGQPVRPAYADVAFAAGVTAPRPYIGDDLRPSTAWHAQFEDVNNDGRADLYVVKGNVEKMPDFAEADPNNLLVQRADGTFAEMGDKAGVASTRVGRGGALVDLNMDGLLDMVAVNRWEPAEVWRNTTGGAGNWVQFRLTGAAPNVDGVGAWVELRTDAGLQRRELTSGGGHAGGQAGWWHFGLGAADKADIRVLWPDGTKGAWMPVTANSFMTI
ncbi:MAG: CRTAC1 family protein, partial [Pseudomonadota bacterium]